MTDRERLIELLSDAPFGVNKQTLKSYLVPEAMADVADRLIANGVTLDYQVSSSKWIPVTERLPIPYVKVFTCRRELLSGAKIISVEYLTIQYDESTMWSGDFETWKSIITHWMPLPEPPKGE
jgi:hypothetical protein